MKRTWCREIVVAAAALVWTVACGGERDPGATDAATGPDASSSRDGSAARGGQIGRAGDAAIQPAVDAGVAPEDAAKPVSSSVDLGNTQISVRGPHIQVLIDRVPFRMRFADEAGHPIVEQAAPDGALASEIKLASPIPAPAAYAPLAFIVGTRTHTQMGGTNAGNSAGGTLNGRQYGAVNVVTAAACCAQAGVDLTLSTSDPSGRLLRVTIELDADGRSAHVTAQADPARDVVVVSDSFVAQPKEAFRGFGGRHNALDQRGQNFYNWVEQENNEVDQTTVQLAPNGPTAAYYVQTSFVSSAGYGFVVDQPEMSSYRLASDRADAWQTSVAAPSLRYMVAVGDPTATIAALTRVTGRQTPAPLWALGAIESQVTSGLGSFDANEYKRLVEADLAAIKTNGTPLTGFQLFQWQHLESLGVLDEVIAKIRAMNLHVLVYFKANLDNSGIGYDSATDYEYARTHGLMVTAADGTPNGMVDFTNPAAVTWWQERLRRAFDRGIDGFMEDFGEQITSDMKFWNGESGDVMHNKYPVLYHLATRAAIDDYQATHPGRELWVYSRSGYNGSAAGEGGTFPGDNASDFGRANGLASSAIDMLNRSLGGAYGVVNHIAGYFDPAFVGVTKEVFLRWTEWAALSPVFLVHNGLLAGTAHSWSYNDPDVIAAFNRYARLHAQAAPLIRQRWLNAKQTGEPIVLPLWLAYPDDAEAARQDQEWLLGRDVLVAPVVTAGATSRPVYFPAGCWADGTTGEMHQGPASAVVAAPLTTLPYYVRCGTTPF